LPQATGAYSSAWLLGRIQHGQKIAIPKLPKLPNGEAEETTISPVLLRTRALTEAVVEQRAFEADPAHRITIDPNRELHPLVRKTRSIFSGRLPSKEPSLDIHVSKASQDRALHLMSAILYAFEERGFKIEMRSEPADNSFVIINDEPLQFSLCEETKKTEAKSEMDSQAETGTRICTKCGFLYQFCKFVCTFWAFWILQPTQIIE
jgi:hypothetical protein